MGSLHGPGVTVERAGARVYFGGDTYAARGEIKALGGHWDADRRQWWLGAAKAAQAEALAARLNGVPAAPSVGLEHDTPREVVADRLEEEGRTAEAAAVRAGPPPKPAEDPRTIRLSGKGEYKGRTYYLGATTRDGRRVRCLTLPDASGKYLDFWADCAEVRVEKTYAPREVWDGRRYSNRTRTEYTTLGSIAAFLARQRDPSRRRGRCTECDAWGPHGEVCSECCEGTYQ